MRRLVVVLALCGACKEKQQAPSPTTKAPAAPVQTGPKPSLPGEPAPASAGDEAPTIAKPNKPITIAEATAAVPAIPGTQIIGLKLTKDEQQAHGTWCIDGTSADDVAKQVGQALGQAKYTGLSIRGDARKAGVVGDRDGTRFSMVVSASSASVCAAPAHYFASATIFKL